ncbi:MAG: class I SAM-dependent methyltransferase [Pseudomonadota bacterium]
MQTSDAAREFAGTIPQLYEQYMVPLIFAPYAEDIARRAVLRRPGSVLEIAAGTGVVTRQLASSLPASTTIVASDLNQAMLDQAATLGTGRPVIWQQADAMHLPFADATFDVVVCQFGAMFFPDKAVAFSEARRVLRPGGAFFFNVWDRIEQNEFADAVTRALTELYPADPPRFMPRIPHGYHDVAVIAHDLQRAGFSQTPSMVTVPMRSRAASARIAATAYCQGTPWRGEIEARGVPGLLEATRIVAEALARQFGDGAVDGGIQAHVVTVER